MKVKNHLLLLCIIFLSPRINAQINVQVGVKTGVNFSTLYQSDGIDYQFKSGFILGSTLELKSPFSQLSVQSEFLFYQFGAGIQESGTEIIINYIQIPLLLRYRFDTPLSDRSPIFFLGAYYNLHTTTDGRIPGIFAAFPLGDVTDTPSKGAIIGGELSFKVFHVGIQSTFDFTETFKPRYSTGEKNFGIALTAGFKF